MSTVENPAAASLFVRSWTQRISGLACSFLRARKNRRDMRRLHGLSDWQLADIGLSRDDLDYAWDCPVIIGDPTLRLDELMRRRDRIEVGARRVV